MDSTGILMKFQKYKWAALVLGIGIVLLLIPSPSNEKNSNVIPEQTGNILSVEESLEEILTQIQGAGKVKVMLTEAVGEETIYQNDTSGSESTGGKRDTVIISDAQRNELGLVRQINPPVYLGAMVVCQGADSPAVRLALVEAVSTVTGLSSDKITVLKMK